LEDFVIHYSQYFSQQSAQNREVLTLYFPRAVGLLFFHLIVLLAPWFFSWKALGVAIFLHWLCGSVGICLGYHRVLTHRSLQLPQWLEYTVATIGALAFQGGLYFGSVTIACTMRLQKTMSVILTRLIGDFGGAICSGFCIPVGKRLTLKPIVV
jgi:hypothetical protein